MGAIITAIIKAIKGLSDKSAYKQNQLNNNASDATDMLGLFSDKNSTRLENRQSDNVASAYSNAVNRIVGNTNFNFKSSDISDATKKHSVLFSR